MNAVLKRTFAVRYALILLAVLYVGAWKDFCWIQMENLAEVRDLL